MIPILIRLVFISSLLCFLVHTISYHEFVIAKASPIRMNKLTDKWTGDFDEMKSKRMIRILIPYSRTLYYIDKGHERGLTIGLARDFERYINKKYRKELGNRPITVYVIPTSRELLIERVLKGEGDIAAGNLTITEKRAESIDFVGLKKQRGNNEIVVTNKNAPIITSINDLSGKTVNVRKSSSYYESLLELNKKFVTYKKKPVRIELVPDDLEDEDMMEMVSAGLLKIIIVDDFKAKIWEQVLPEIQANYKVLIREKGKIGWMIRKHSSKLNAELEDFYDNYVEKTSVYDVRILQEMERGSLIKDNLIDADTENFQSIQEIFKKYGKRYHFDPLILSAQGYQESKLNQNARSSVGAIGIMQVMPNTGEQMKVGDITKTEENIHAGTKYMYILMKKHFNKANLDEYNRMLFALASYNAGSAKISRMRGLTSACNCGLDENKWFNNVEIVTGGTLGLETTTYVRNIFKYYVSYRLIMDKKNKKIKK